MVRVSFVMDEWTLENRSAKMESEMFLEKVDDGWKEGFQSITQ